MPGIRAGYPLSERQQVALLMQMTAEESINSPGACLSWAPRLGGREPGVGPVASVASTVPDALSRYSSFKHTPQHLIRIQLNKITLINFHYFSEMNLCNINPLLFISPPGLLIE